ncbi:hypothetical protein NA56DRAFT_734899 [Hyaloscypha hepaticicola]|uniref:Uncharacterized protein n=1 Tax=Hyaloscypha hepaticicola TaxID=2082293 RepID=A0A2J6PKP0_9HELO|nr:hypothetical protein NA56DRAFT_734899 [Hyaloscypha hepaticicola]
MEPRFSLPATTPLSSKRELVIGGAKIYIYGLDELIGESSVEIAIAHEVLHRYRSDGRKKKKELIAVTMDMRNYGWREVSKKANLTWKDGNEKACDFKFILDFLPTYFPQFTHFHNILLVASLISLNQTQGFAIVVGLDASEFRTTPSELGYLKYDQLEAVMTKEQRRLWPRVLAELVQEGDRTVYESFPVDVPTLICNGKQYQLVPTFFTEEWLEKRREKRLVADENENVKLFVQENTGHSCTKKMVALISDWIGGIFESRIERIEECPTILVESRL